MESLLALLEHEQKGLAVLYQLPTYYLLQSAIVNFTQMVIWSYLNMEAYSKNV